MTYTCKICQTTSDVSEFYKGVNTRCKECHKKKVKENREANADYYREYDAKRYKEDPRVRARHKRYQKTEAGKASIKKSNLKWKLKNPEKRAAHVILGNRLKDGTIHKPDLCECCGKGASRIHGHHEDYAQPLNVVWCCPKCHEAIHRGNIKVSLENGKFTPKT